MKPIQLPLSVRLRDDATFANYYPGANAAALGYVERLCEAEAGWAESLIYLWGHDGVGRSHLLQAACLRFEQFEERTIYLPMADLVQYGPEIFDDLEQCELVCIDDLDVLVGKRVGRGAVPPVQSTARYRSAPAAGGIEVARSCRSSCRT